jgi:hypothetical protein
MAQHLPGLKHLLFDDAFTRSRAVGYQADCLSLFRFGDRIEEHPLRPARLAVEFTFDTYRREA